MLWIDLSGLTIPVCLGLTLVKQTQFHLSQITGVPGAESITTKFKDIPGPEVPPSPDYIPSPEVPPSPDYIPGPEGPPSPDYVPGQKEPEAVHHLPRLFYLIITWKLDHHDNILESDPEEIPEEEPADTLLIGMKMMNEG
ncbi:hypothetical protein Tco_0483962 [Tanacetum coccineum]